MARSVQNGEEKERISVLIVMLDMYVLEGILAVISSARVDIIASEEKTIVPAETVLEQEIFLHASVLVEHLLNMKEPHVSLLIPPSSGFIALDVFAHISTSPLFTCSNNISHVSS